MARSFSERLLVITAEEDPPWAKEGEDMFGVFLDRFSRPISQASVRTTSTATMQVRHFPAFSVCVFVSVRVYSVSFPSHFALISEQALGPRANTHDASTTMATSLAAMKKSRASAGAYKQVLLVTLLLISRGVFSERLLLIAASYASRTDSSASLSNLSQYLGPQRSLPNLSTTADTLGSTKEIMSLDATAAIHAGSDSDSDEGDQQEDARAVSFTSNAAVPQASACACAF